MPEGSGLRDAGNGILAGVPNLIDLQTSDPMRIEVIARDLVNKKHARLRFFLTIVPDTPRSGYLPSEFHITFGIVGKPFRVNTIPLSCIYG